MKVVRLTEKAGGCIDQVQVQCCKCLSLNWGFTFPKMK